MTRLPPVHSPEALPFLGRYQLQKKLAVGGMAEIYLAHSSGAGGFKKQVVVKRILPQLAESEELYQMFLDEARIAATLQHSNIVQVYDACEDDGEFFMAMEYLDGTDLRTLRRVLAKSNMAIGWEHSLHIISSIASGLHYAHKKCALDGTPLHIVHRDVSPQNIFLTREGSVKLVDFGIAKAEGRSTETAVGTLKGKLAYMAPEQCASNEVDHRADIYSLGVILYELTTGRRLYSSETEYQLINEIVEGEIQPPSASMEYPAELERIVLRCLKKDPRDRYDSARDIQADLNIFARDYQLICSTLGFSLFIEPLLAQASAEADGRWKHRKGIRPISLKSPELQPDPRHVKRKELPADGSGSYFEASEPDPLAAVARADSSPILAPPAPATLDRADEIIEDFLSAKHRRQPPRRRDLANPTPLAVNTNLLENFTRPVPADMLEHIRREERLRILSEKDEAARDAVPRLARGSRSGELSVSKHVVRRETGRSVVLQSPQIEDEGPETQDQDFVPAESCNVIFESDIEEDVAPASHALPEAREQRRVATVLVTPAHFALAGPRDLSIHPKRNKLWLGVGILAAASIAAALFVGNARKRSNAGVPAALRAKPALGSLTIQATSDAEVWLYLGKTPLTEASVHGEKRGLRLRLEREGYLGQERVLGPESWSRNSKGAKIAAASFQLRPEESSDGKGTPALGPSPALGDAALPQALSISSSPSAVDAWLYVGTTPDVRIGELKTNEKVEVRILQEGQPPMYRIVPPTNFDAEGRASLHLDLATPAPSSETPNE